MSSHQEQNTPEVKASKIAQVPPQKKGVVLDIERANRGRCLA